MKTLLKTALVIAGLAAVAIPAAAQAPGGGPGFGLNPNCPYVQQDRDKATTQLPARPMRMMRRMQAEDGTWTCPRLNGQTAILPDGAAKVPGMRDGTGPWWLRQATPDKTD